MMGRLRSIEVFHSSRWGMRLIRVSRIDEDGWGKCAKSWCRWCSPCCCCCLGDSGRDWMSLLQIGMSVQGHQIWRSLLTSRCLFHTHSLSIDRASQKGWFWRVLQKVIKRGIPLGLSTSSRTKMIVVLWFFWKMCNGCPLIDGLLRRRKMQKSQKTPKLATFTLS